MAGMNGVYSKRENRTGEGTTHTKLEGAAKFKDTLVKQRVDAEERQRRIENLGVRLTHSDEYLKKIQFYAEKKARSEARVASKLAKVEREAYDKMREIADRENERWDYRAEQRKIGVEVMYVVDEEGVEDRGKRVERSMW